MGDDWSGPRNCPTCGSIALFVGSTKIGSLNPHATRRQDQRLLLLPRFSLRTGAVTIKVTSNGKDVQIDGLITSRT